ncbi:hypothetical protein NPA31_005050 [Aurantimonas sp. MSK8Z-1]|nr:hypothetical protein [Aurantimonas sp. MSK8Z-1]
MSRSPRRSRDRCYAPARRPDDPLARRRRRSTRRPRLRRCGGAARCGNPRQGRYDADQPGHRRATCRPPERGTGRPRLMPYRLSPSDKVVVDGVEYVPAAIDRSGYTLRRLDPPDIHESFTLEAFGAGLRDGTVQVFRDHFSLRKTRRRLTRCAFSLADLAPHKRDKTLYRLDVCKGFEEMRDQGQAKLSDVSMKKAIARIAGRITEVQALRESADGRCGTKVTIWRPPSPRTLRRWLAAYDAFGVEGLVDWYENSGNRKDRLDPEARSILAEFAAKYVDRRRPTKNQIHLDMSAEFLRVNVERKAGGLPSLLCPSKAALADEIAELDPWETYVGRHGLDKAKKKYFPRKGGQTFYRPLEMVAMDEHRIKLVTVLIRMGVYESLSPDMRKKVKKARLWVSFALDLATRYCLAAKIVAAPSGASAMATLREVIAGDDDIADADGDGRVERGSPEAVATDNGAGFIEEIFRIALAELEIEHVLGPAGVPQMRGALEAFHRFFHSSFAARFDGRTHGNVVARGDYDAMAHAVLDPTMLNELLQDWRVNFYNRRPHAGLGGESPLGAWRRLAADVDVLPPPHPTVMRHVLGRPSGATVGNNGVRVEGLDYNSLALQKARPDIGNAPVPIRIEDRDRGQVSVRVPAGWLTVPCVRKEMAGVSSAQHAAGLDVLAARNAVDASRNEKTMLEAVRRIQSASDEASKRVGLSPPRPDAAALACIWDWQERAFAVAERDADDQPFLDLDDDPTEAPVDCPNAPEMPSDRDGTGRDGAAGFFLEE